MRGSPRHAASSGPRDSTIWRSPSLRACSVSAASFSSAGAGPSTALFTFRPTNPSAEVSARKGMRIHLW